MESLVDKLQSIGNGLSGVLIGAGIGIYATVVFQRYTKFKDVVADLAYRMMTVGEHVEQLDHTQYNPAQLWVAASSVIREHIQPCYFLLAVHGHDEAKRRLDAQLKEILDGLFEISDEIAKRPIDDPELAQFAGNRSFFVKLRWGFHFHRFRDVWTVRMMKLEPDWEVVFCVDRKIPPNSDSNVV